MNLINVVLITSLLTLAIGLSIERDHVRRYMLESQKMETTNDESSFDQGISKWLNRFLSGNSNTEKQPDSFSKLALLKNLLLSSSSSSDKSGKLDKLFQVLTQSATDVKNESSSSSNKLNRILGFFNDHGSSSNNLQLAIKLLNLSQGNGGLSSLGVSDLKSLAKFFG